MPTAVMVGYGDRGNTMQAVAMADVDKANLVESDYSDSGFKVVEEGEGDQEILILNYDSFHLS
jgi:hypothetical protein